MGGHVSKQRGGKIRLIQRIFGAKTVFAESIVRRFAGGDDFCTNRWSIWLVAGWGSYKKIN